MRWAINKHLDYVSTFNFQSKSGDDATDRRIEELMTWWSQPRNCDAAGRHRLGRLVRLLEACNVVDGDVLVLKLADGRLQAIEGDRIRTPYGPFGTGMNPVNLANIYHGVEVDPAGAALKYYVSPRDKSGQFLAGRYTGVPAGDAWLLGYFDRIDQTRGISPLASGLNTFLDVYEGIDYALARAKILQLFGLKFTRKDSDEPLEPPSTSTAADGTASETSADDSGYPSPDISKGIFKLDMNPGDDAAFLESSQPSSEFKEFMLTATMIALTSLDIPLTFLKSSEATFFGNKADWIHYFASACEKRKNLRELLDNVTLWKVSVWVASGLLKLPAGWKIWDLKWDWLASGVPWANPVDEIQRDLTALKMGVTTRTRICKQLGIDFRDLVDELEAEEKLLKSKHLPVDLTSLLAKAGVPTGVAA